ncbi:hypothetical protein DFP72DRAFT_841647 [Ephemerocybe angulata]|uniref:Uncharacterized protein n=1 Tax=Ephemerocybe angulata TaxID=980116 RepID=A0A8H6IBM6_9AGAR|nr:hypothetical protein DFP72DRAFT_841647 [Tulosesus angulatus]
MVGGRERQNRKRKKGRGPKLAKRVLHPRRLCTLGPRRPRPCPTTATKLLVDSPTSNISLGSQSQEFYHRTERLSMPGVKWLENLKQRQRSGRKEGGRAERCLRCSEAEVIGRRARLAGAVREESAQSPKKQRLVAFDATYEAQDAQEEDTGSTLSPNGKEFEVAAEECRHNSPSMKHRFSHFPLEHAQVQPREESTQGSGPPRGASRRPVGFDKFNLLTPIPLADSTLQKANPTRQRPSGLWKRQYPPPSKTVPQPSSSATALTPTKSPRRWNLCGRLWKTAVEARRRGFVVELDHFHRASSDQDWCFEGSASFLSGSLLGLACLCAVFVKRPELLNRGLMAQENDESSPKAWWDSRRLPQQTVLRGREVPPFGPGPEKVCFGISRAIASLSGGSKFEIQTREHARVNIAKNRPRLSRLGWGLFGPIGLLDRACKSIDRMEAIEPPRTGYSGALKLGIPVQTVQFVGCAAWVGKRLTEGHRLAGNCSAFCLTGGGRVDDIIERCSSRRVLGVAGGSRVGRLRDGEDLWFVNGSMILEPGLLEKGVGGRQSLKGAFPFWCRGSCGRRVMSAQESIDAGRTGKKGWAVTLLGIKSPTDPTTQTSLACLCCDNEKPRTISRPRPQASPSACPPSPSLPAGPLAP